MHLLITNLLPSLAPEAVEMFLNSRPPKLLFSLQKMVKKSDLKLFLFHQADSFRPFHFRYDSKMKNRWPHSVSVYQRFGRALLDYGSLVRAQASKIYLINKWCKGIENKTILLNLNA
jgi:hypothetical protein